MLDKPNPKQSASDPSARNRRIVWTGAILVTVGFSLLLFAGEWFATFHARVANPTCTAGASPGVITDCFALMVAGVDQEELAEGFAVFDQHTRASYSGMSYSPSQRQTALRKWSVPLT